MAARSKAWIFDRSLAGIVGSNPAGSRMYVVYVVCCQEEFSASCWWPVYRSPTECGVSECHRGASTVRRPWPTRGFRAMEGGGGQICTVFYRQYSQCIWPLKQLLVWPNHVILLIQEFCEIRIFHLRRFSWVAWKLLEIALEFRGTQFGNHCHNPSLV